MPRIAGQGRAQNGRQRADRAHRLGRGSASTADDRNAPTMERGRGDAEGTTTKCGAWKPPLLPSWSRLEGPLHEVHPSPSARNTPRHRAPGRAGDDATQTEV